jgi:hypothetical protein
MVCVVSVSVDGRAWIVQVHGFTDRRPNVTDALPAVAG